MPSAKLRFAKGPSCCPLSSVLSAPARIMSSAYACANSCRCNKPVFGREQKNQRKFKRIRNSRGLAYFPAKDADGRCKQYYTAPAPFYTVSAESRQHLCHSLDIYYYVADA